MSASVQFLSLTPKTLSLHHNSSSSVAAAPCFFNLKPLPKFVLSISSVNSHAVSASRFVRRVAYTSDLEESFSETEEGEDEQSFSPDLKLFVGNLPFNVDSAALAGLFEQVGTVEMVEVIYDKETGRSRGFGFVTMSSAEEVKAAENQYNGYELQGRAIRVNSGPAPPKSENSFGGQRDNSSFRGGRDNSSFRGGRDNSSFRSGSRDDYRGSRDNSSFRGGSRDDFRGGSRDSSSFRGGSRGEGSFDNSNRVYVGNLSWGVDNLALETLFSEQGRVKEAKVVYDRESGRSRGFGFVTFGSPQEVSKAVEKLDGMDLDGRSIRVSPAEERQRPQF